jgi:hypothetical protein
MSLLFSAGGAPVSRPSGSRHAAATAIIADSWFPRLLARGAAVIVIAWGRSAARALFLALSSESRRDPSQGVRLVSVAVLCAAIVHVLLVGVEALLRPPMTGLLWVLAIPVAFVTVCLPGPAVRAWHLSRTFGRRKPRGE